MKNYICDCGELFKTPVTSGHKRKCEKYKEKHPSVPVPRCVCGHESTSMTQMKRHRSECDAWKSRDTKSQMLERRSATNVEKFGVTSVMHNQLVKDKIATTNVERYGSASVFDKKSSLSEKVKSGRAANPPKAVGSRNSFARPEVQEKIKKHWMETHGVDNPVHVEEIKEKARKTNLERYGHSCPLAAPEVQEKSKKTSLARYGHESPSASPVVKSKITATNMERYGVQWTTTGVSRDKQYETQIAKYGDKFMASEYGKAAILAALLANAEVRKKSASKNKFESLVHKLAPSLVFTGGGTFWKRLPSIGITKNPDFIVPGPNRSHKTSGVTKVVECLGVYWHGYDQTGIERHYYEEILIDAYKRIGISCMVVWEDETWDDMSLLTEKLAVFTSSTVSEPTSVVDFSITDAVVSRSTNPAVYNFLSEYHYAGCGRGASCSYTASINNVIIAVAKFSPPVRQTIRKSDGVGDVSVIELDRFCINPDYQKHNMASYFMSRALGLLKVDRPDISVVVSYADPAAGHNGAIYKASNWTAIGKTSTSHVYECQGGVVMNKKTLYNRARAVGLTEKEYADKNGAKKVSLPPKLKFVYKLR